MVMEAGDLDFTNHELICGSNVGNIGDLPNDCSMDSFLDDFLKDAHACTHAHTCNPPGPDSSHTHTCYHVHTKIMPPSSEDVNPSDDTSESTDKKSKKRPLGNREAVRKYREKKKARAASLEDEVVRLRSINQQLAKRLQGQAVLEAEIARLKCLLVDIRGRIEGEIGSFPYQKSTKTGDIYQTPITPNMPSAYLMNPCNLQCDDQVYCLHPGEEGRNAENAVLNGQGLAGCDFENGQCLGTQNFASDELPGCELGSGVPAINTSAANKRKGGARAARGI